jgi:hypothetical protein
MGLQDGKIQRRVRREKIEFAEKNKEGIRNKNQKSRQVSTAECAEYADKNRILPRLFTAKNAAFRSCRIYVDLRYKTKKQKCNKEMEIRKEIRALKRLLYLIF